MEEQQKVLFVVYRTEWWGCFDSLCRQEAANDNVLCYVMPIPRYDREQKSGEVDTTRKRFTPEVLKSQLPKGAVWVDYENFSMEQQFDRIYIHNPYDETSCFDSVSEKYYSWSLKKRAKRLIYVPHLLYMESIPTTFVQSPVYKNVDVILLSDERARYSMEVVYEDKVEMVPSGIVEYLERLNSEKVNSTKNTRKRLLFCVSFDDLYQGAELQIEKMWNIFTYMETREDIELIFRADEDIPFRYAELPKKIREEYEALISYFKKRKIGILDENLNPYQMAVEADVIMSRSHPLDTMFSIMGKYVISLYYDVRQIVSEEERCIPFLGAMTVDERENLLFVPAYSGIIYRMIRPDGQVEVISQIPEEIVAWCNYSDMIKVKNCIYLAPFLSNGIWKYDMEKKTFGKQYLLGAEGECMSRIIPYGEYLYFIPREYPGIVKYHMETEEFQIIDSWVEQLNSFVSPERKMSPYFVRAVKLEGNMLYLASAKCDVWMEMNLDTEQWTIRRMGLMGYRAVDMVKDGEEVWLFPYRGTDVVKWNCVTNESKVLHKSKRLDDFNSPYSLAVDLGNKVVAFPELEEHVLIISKKQNDNVEYITDKVFCGSDDYTSEYLKNGRGLNQKAGYQFVQKLSNNRILVYEYYDGSYLLLDDELGIVEKMSCRVPLEMIHKQWNTIWKGNVSKKGFKGILQECESFPIIVDFVIRQEDNVVQEVKDYHRKFLIVNRVITPQNL